MTFNPYIQSGIKLNYAFNGRIMIGPVKEVNGVRSCFTCRVAKHAIYRKKCWLALFRGGLPLCDGKNQFFRWHARIKKKREKEGRGKKKCYTNVLFHEIGRTDGRAVIEGEQICPNWTLWLMRPANSSFHFKYVNRQHESNGVLSLP